MGNTGLDTVVGCGTIGDYYPSQTAEDWVSYADHVVVATPTRERDTNRHDYRTGTLQYRTDREVTFRTDDTIWSAGRPGQAIGGGFAMTAPGWNVYRDGDRVKRTATDAPRLEIGHTYILALRWADGQWEVLGEGAAIPFDGQVADQGEWCGRVLGKDDVSRGERFSRNDDHSVEKAVFGEGAQAVRRELAKAGSKK